MLDERSVCRGIVRCRFVSSIVAAVLAATPCVAGPDGAPEVSKQFVERIMHGRYSETTELLDATMRSAFHEVRARSSGRR